MGRRFLTADTGPARAIRLIFFCSRTPFPDRPNQPSERVASQAPDDDLEHPPEPRSNVLDQRAGALLSAALTGNAAPTRGVYCRLTFLSFSTVLFSLILITSMQAAGRTGASIGAPAAAPKLAFRVGYDDAVLDDPSFSRPLAPTQSLSEMLKAQAAAQPRFK
jgi:hypothetical protein